MGDRVLISFAGGTAAVAISSYTLFCAKQTKSIGQITQLHRQIGILNKIHRTQ